jgi:hypothetical protein
VESEHGAKLRLQLKGVTPGELASLIRALSRGIATAEFVGQ